MGWIANCSITKNSSIRSGKRLRRLIAASKVTDDSPVKEDKRTVAVTNTNNQQADLVMFGSSLSNTLSSLRSRWRMLCLTRCSIALNSCSRTVRRNCSSNEPL